MNKKRVEHIKKKQKRGVSISLRHFVPLRNEQCALEEVKGRVRGGEARHGDHDRWRRWQVVVVVFVVAVVGRVVVVQMELVWRL